MDDSVMKKIIANETEVQKVDIQIAELKLKRQTLEFEHMKLNLKLNNGVI